MVKEQEPKTYIVFNKGPGNRNQKLTLYIGL